MQIPPLPSNVVAPQQAALDHYELMVDIMAFSTKAYWAMWGPLGIPVIDGIDRWAHRQREYIQPLRNESS